MKALQRPVELITQLGRWALPKDEETKRVAIITVDILIIVGVAILAYIILA